MSTLKAELVTIKTIVPHANADRLEIATVFDYQVVVRKDEFKSGELVLYVPIDSVLPTKFEEFLFPPESKIKLSKSRVKAIRIRGFISQGMVIPIQDVHSFLGNMPHFYYGEGDDYTAALGITKFEPKENRHTNFNVQGKSKPFHNSNFHKYTEIENGNRFSKVFVEGEEVVCTEKCHGSNFRAGYVPVEINSFWKKIKKFLHLLPPYEFVYGSHNVQMQDKKNPALFYDSNIYKEMVDKYRLKEDLHSGVVIYGEIYGDGVQKGYTYGCLKGEHKLVVFDIMMDEKYLDNVGFQFYAKLCSFPLVPVIEKCVFSVEKMKELSQGMSILWPDNIREGIVVKPLVERHNGWTGRTILKYINPEYLMNIDETTENH